MEEERASEHHSKNNIWYDNPYTCIPACTEQWSNPEYLIGYSSHVLLAACSDHEAAMENISTKAGTRSGGAFTQSLLKQLESMETAAFKRLTYRDLIEIIRPGLVETYQ